MAHANVDLIELLHGHRYVFVFPSLHCLVYVYTLKINCLQMANYSRYTNTPLTTYYVQFRSELKKNITNESTCRL